MSNLPVERHSLGSYIVRCLAAAAGIDASGITEADLDVLLSSELGIVGDDHAMLGESDERFRQRLVQRAINLVAGYARSRGLAKGPQ